MPGVPRIAHAAPATAVALSCLWLAVPMACSAFGLSCCPTGPRRPADRPGRERRACGSTCRGRSPGERRPPTSALDHPHGGPGRTRADQAEIRAVRASRISDGHCGTVRVPIHHPAWSSHALLLMKGSAELGRARRRTSTYLICAGALIGSGSGRSGAARPRARCGRCQLSKVSHGRSARRRWLWFQIGVRSSTKSCLVTIASCGGSLDQTPLIRGVVRHVRAVNRG